MKFRSLQIPLIFRELWLERRQTAVSLVAFIITIFIVGLISRVDFVLINNLNQQFEAANPPSHIISTSGFLDLSIINEIAALPEIVEAEAFVENRDIRMQFGDELWRPVILFARSDFDNLQFEKIIYEDGTKPPVQTGEILLERSASDLTAVQPFDTVQIDNTLAVHEAIVAGFVYAPIYESSRFSRRIMGYTTIETMLEIGGMTGYNQILIKVAPDANLAQAEASIASVLAQHDHSFYSLKARPSEPLIVDFIEPVGYLFNALGSLAILLTIFLVNTTMSGLMAQKMSEVGQLKAIGFSNHYILKIYLMKSLLLGGVGLLIAVPLEMLVSIPFATAVAAQLNVNIDTIQTPIYVLGLELLVGLLLPLMATYLPVKTAASQAAIKSLNANDVQETRPVGWLARRLSTLPHLPPSFLYSCRNLLRHRRRTVFMLLPLMVAGAIFVTILNVRLSLNQEVVKVTGYWQEDIRLSFSEPIGSALVRNELSTISGIESVEPRLFQEAKRIHQVPTDAKVEELLMVGVSPDTETIVPTLIEGRWLTLLDSHQIVLNADYLRSEPDLAVGDTLHLAIENEAKAEFEIVGIVSGQVIGGTGAFQEPMAFVNGRYLEDTVGQLGKATHFIILTTRPDSAFQVETALALENLLKTYQLSPDHLDLVGELRLSIRNIFQVAIQVTILMAALFGIIGLIGVTTLIRLTLFERRHEINSLKAVGASSAKVRGLFLNETLLLGLLSWLVSAPLAMGLTAVLNQGLGRLFVNASLTAVFAPLNYLSWLILITFFIILTTTLSIKSNLTTEQNYSKETARRDIARYVPTSNQI
ncbi:MAG: FtsX-like permease family protein [Chloroflexota bacterium]